MYYSRNQDFKLLMEDFIRRFEHLIKDQNQSFRQTIKDVMERYALVNITQYHGIDVSTILTNIHSGDFLMTDNFQDISSLFVEISKATLAMLGVDLSKGALKPRTFRWGECIELSYTVLAVEAGVHMYVYTHSIYV